VRATTSTQRPEDNSCRPHLDHAARVAEPVPHLRLTGVQESQLAHFTHSHLAQPSDVPGLDPVQVDAEVAGGRIHDADGAARMQPVGPELLHERVDIERRRARELLLREDARVADPRHAAPCVYGRWWWRWRRGRLWVRGRGRCRGGRDAWLGHADARHDLDDAARVAHPIPHLRFGPIEEMQLLNVAGVELA